MENSGAKVKKWNEVMHRLAVQVKEESMTDQKPARMDCTAEDALADHAESADWKTVGVKILQRKAYARLGN